MTSYPDRLKIGREVVIRAPGMEVLDAKRRKGGNPIAGQQREEKRRNGFIKKLAFPRLPMGNDLLGEVEAGAEPKKMNRPKINSVNRRLEDSKEPIKSYCSNPPCRRVREFESYFDDVFKKKSYRCKTCGLNKSIEELVLEGNLGSSPQAKK